MNRTPETIENKFWAHFAAHIRKITMASRISNIFYAILGLSTAVVDFLDVPYGNLRLLRTKAAEVLRYLVLIDIAKGGNCTVDYNPVPLHHRPVKGEVEFWVSGGNADVAYTNIFIN